MYSNTRNISLAVAAWLAADDGYDLSFDPYVLSATDLLRPMRSLVLSRRVKQNTAAAGPVDLVALVPSRLGTAIHTAVETAWIEHRHVALRNLGIPQKVIDRININPDKPSTESDAIDIYLEQRRTRDVGHYTISGKFDLVEQGRVKDIKTTKTYNYIKGTNNAKYAMQGSIYRWLNTDIITDSFMSVEYIFTNWSQWEAEKNPEYPQAPAVSKVLPLKTLEEIGEYIRNRVRQYDDLKDKPENELPLCTPKELWMDPPKWAFYNTPGAKRATKLYNSQSEANYAASMSASGRVEERLSEPTFCKYCEGRPMCTQAEGYINQGLLKL